MSRIIAVGGDVNFSKHRGEIAHLVTRRRGSAGARIYRKLLKQVMGLKLPDHSPTRVINEVLLADYGKAWTYGQEEYDETVTGGPFAEVGSLFRAASLAVVNLETPLCEDGRHVGAFCSHPRYAAELRTNNIRVVSVANNHAFDAGEQGFQRTLETLRSHGIKYCGGGMNLSEARAGCVVDADGLNMGFLAYTSVCNSFFISLATSTQSGILPLYLPLVLDDIAAMRRRCDFLVVALHFDMEDTSRVHPSSVEVAHSIIDQGADLVLGSHGHVPKPLEVYKGKLIVYCLGNLIFTTYYPQWAFSLMGELSIDDSGGLDRASFSAIDCRGPKCFSPAILETPEAERILSCIAAESKKRFGTNLFVSNHRLLLPGPLK